MKLTDTQLVLLSAAAQREDGGVEIGPSLKGAASRKVIGKLLSERLIEEIPAHGSVPVWRRDPDEGQFALRITEGGLAAIGAEPKAGEARVPGQGRSAGTTGVRPEHHAGRPAGFGESPSRPRVRSRGRLR